MCEGGSGKGGPKTRQVAVGVVGAAVSHQRCTATDTYTYYILFSNQLMPAYTYNSICIYLLKCNVLIDPADHEQRGQGGCPERASVEKV